MGVAECSWNQWLNGTGIRSERDDAGEFPAGSVNYRIEWKLREWAIIATQMNQTQDETD
jgi:hypothetical protein